MNRNGSLGRVAAAGMVFFAVLAGALLEPFPGDAAEGPVAVGTAVPEFTVQALAGGILSFEKDIRGKSPLTVLFFMTTACSACYQEMKELDDFVRKHPGTMKVWCVAVDLRGEKTVKPFARENRFQFEYLLDPKFVLPRVFGFNYTPSLAVIDSRGVLLHKKGGYSPGEDLTGLLRKYLR